MPLTIAQAGELRLVVLDHLVGRFPLSYEADAIGRMLVRHQVIDFTPSAQDMAAALLFLKEEQLVAEILDDLSAISTWQATSKGVQRQHRRRVASNPEEGSHL
jgi:hypothetical protein